MVTKFKHYGQRSIFVIFVAMIGVLGGHVGAQIQNKNFPVSLIERVNLTPVVRPGESLLLAQALDRRDQCDVVVKRTIKTADGRRYAVRQVFDEGFGPLGGDRYILPIPTDSASTLGKAEMFSKSQSWCSWLDYILPASESEPWTLEFTFGERTQIDDLPPSFSGIGFKSSKESTPKSDP